MPHVYDSRATSTATVNLTLLQSDDEHEYESSLSPYPPSTPSIAGESDAESDATPTSSTQSTSLHTSIASISEFQLRAIVVKLAADSPDFRRAVKKELLKSPTVVAITPRVHRKNRHGPRRSTETVRAPKECVNCGRRFNKGHVNLQDGECSFHPGK